MNEYLTTEDVAQRLGVRVETVRRWIRSGQLPGSSIGRAGYRIHWSDFERFVRGQRQLDVSMNLERDRVGMDGGVERVGPIASNVGWTGMEGTATMILERMTDGVLLFGFDGRCVYANEGVGRLLDQKSEKLPGKTLVELFPGSTLDADTIAIGQGDNYFSHATERWYQVRVFATPNGRCMSFLDVTERKRAEEAQHESEQRFRRLVESYAQTVWETNAAGEVVKDSPSWRAYTGQTFEEWIGYGWVNAIYPDDQKYAERQWRETVAMGGEVNAEFRLKHAKGGYRWTNVRAMPLFSEDGVIVKWVGMNIDIDDRKRAEEALLEERVVLESFYNSVPFMMGVTELDGDSTVAISANQKIADFFGREKDDFGGHSGTELGTPEEIEHLWVEQYRMCADEQHIMSFAYREPRLSGSGWLNVTIAYIGIGPTGRPRFSFVVEDITERQRIQDALRESERRVQAERQRLYDLFMQAPAVIIVTNGPDHVFELVNPVALQILGATRQVVGKPVIEAMPELEGQGYVELLDSVYQSGKPYFGSESLIQFDARGDGTLDTDYFNFVCQPSYDAAGEIDGVLVYANDVTETVLARKRIEESEQRLRALADSMPQLVWSADAAGEIDFFNQRIREYADIARNEKGIYDWRDIIHADDLKSTEFAWAQAKVRGTAFEHEQRMHMRDGTYRWHLARGVPVHDKHGAVVRWYGTKTDIEQMKQLERQKNDFLGVVSHELKTPVTSAKAFAEVLENRFHRAGDQGSADLLSKLGAQMDKLTRLISDLLDITRLDAGKLRFQEGYFDFDEMIDVVSEEVQRTARHIIRREGRVGRKVYGDGERIGQVITNLLTNAIKYSPDAVEVVIHVSTSEQEVVVCVQDFGIGIAREKLPYVFERFFRENEGEGDTFAGLGLGLYVSAEIIQHQGGIIWAESKKGSGSTFCFRLPYQRVDAMLQQTDDNVGEGSI